VLVAEPGAEPSEDRGGVAPVDSLDARGLAAARGVQQVGGQVVGAQRPLQVKGIETRLPEASHLRLSGG
jgi:hypothetical protein